MPLHEPLQPPFIELNFYHAKKPQKDAFKKMLNACLESDATLINQALVASTHHEDIPHFHDILFLERQMITFEPNQLEALLSSNDTFVLSLYLANAIGTRPNSIEQLTYGRISEYASQIDNHPIVIWCSGDMFGFNDLLEQQAAMVVYDRFRYLTEKTNPSYSAITSEWTLECPTDLKNLDSTLSFRNFFLNEELLTSIDINAIKTNYAGAHIEQWDNGIYISTYNYAKTGRINWNVDYPSKEQASKFIIQLLTHKFNV